MVRVPSCEKLGLKKGPWTPEEDHTLITFIQRHGHSSWRALPKQAGLQRCGKSCRLRWTNYLRPGIKRGNFSPQEENTIIQLHATMGNRWSTIATHLPGRTDNEIKNHWNTRLRKKLLKMGLDPTTHRPWPQQQPLHAPLPSSMLLSLLQGAPSPADPIFSVLNALLLGSNSFANNNIGLFPAAPGHVVQNNGSAPAAAAAPPSSSILIPPPAVLDPAVPAAAETRRVLDYLKFNNAENQATCSTSDQQLNQLLTRLLLIKLLQGSDNHPPTAPVNPAAGHNNKASIHNINQRSGLLSANHLLQNQGLNREPAAPSAYASPNLCAALNDNSIPTAVLLNMLRSSSQQRLPFVADSVIEPCTSAAATDHLSSTSPHQLSQASFFNCPQELTTPNSSLTSQQSPLWPGHARRWGDNEVLPSSASHLMASGAQLLAGAGITQNNDYVPQTLMTWEEHLMREQKGCDRDFASSSTVSSSTLDSSASESHAAPNTGPTHNFNMHDYWSDLLHLISSSK